MSIKHVCISVSFFCYVFYISSISAYDRLRSTVSRLQIKQIGIANYLKKHIKEKKSFTYFAWVYDVSPKNKRAIVQPLIAISMLRWQMRPETGRYDDSDD